MLYDPKWEAPADIKLADWQKVLLNAVTLLEQHGWVQQEIGNKDVGFCAYGAIRAAAAQNYMSHPRNLHAGFYSAADLLSKKVGDNIAIWNDTPGRTKEEVIATLKEIANAV